MLTALHIQDFVLIDQLSLPLGEGLIALTGETGAGKSILLEALGLAAGGRSGRGQVRRGAERGVVAAAFEPLSDHPVWRLLDENAISAEDGQIILRRIQNADGKSRAFINDQPVSISLLREVGEALIEIHGQHEGVSFLTAATHRGLLDDFGGLGGKAQRVEKSWARWRDALALLEERKATREAALREADYLRHVVDELGNLDPKFDEENELSLRRTELLAAQKITEDLSAAASLMSDDGLDGKLSAAAHRLSRAAGSFPPGSNPLDEALERIDQVLSGLLDARAAVEEAADRLGADEKALETVEERLFALRAAARKYGVRADRLPEYLEKSETALATLDENSQEFVSLEKEAVDARVEYFKEAGSLSAERLKKAEQLDKSVQGELAPLKLAKAQFKTSIVSDELRAGAHGYDAVEFMVATNPGAPMGPLKTIASGGELSRFVLAMKAALAAKESRTVIIFDEVDAGVGGAVADAVGERLARLARDAQVLVVTHSPQVAARAKVHWRVEKRQSTTDTKTSVTALGDNDRVEEIARMLSGAVVTDEARAAARKLLGASAEPKPARKKRAS
ncbi:MAG: DNA repair protein RecN [Parvularculaceae bacterium]